MSTYRQDPEWQGAQAEYIEPGEDLSVDERLFQRIKAAKLMQVIECRHEGVPIDELNLSQIPGVPASLEGAAT